MFKHQNLSACPSSQQNHLLAALPPADLDLLLPQMELVNLDFGHSLHEAGVVQAYVYFPIDCIASIYYVMLDGQSSEIAVIGNEGLVGLSLFMGGTTTTSFASVLSTGSAWRIKGSFLKREFNRGGLLQGLLLRYTQALITQMTQTAVCNRYHTVEQQLCRRLLLSLDRMSSNELIMTQEQIASILGVRRGGVTEAAGRLQSAGLIQYSRGRIIVQDRPRLEARSCEC